MLPVATPTNAIIFASGNIKVKDMIITGIFIKIVGILVVFAASNFWLGLIFDIDQLPKSFRISLLNVTNSSFLNITK
jgi:solute carrier family 13 (sodium-dependent dicarboxylate transporter), member 2/3/5